MDFWKRSTLEIYLHSYVTFMGHAFNFMSRMKPDCVWTILVERELLYVYHVKKTMPSTYNTKSVGINKGPPEQRKLQMWCMAQIHQGRSLALSASSIIFVMFGEKEGGWKQGIILHRQW